MFNPFVPYLILFFSFSTTLLFVSILNRKPRNGKKTASRVVVTGTFHNPNWFISHARPLAESGLKRVIFVCDIPHTNIKGVEFFCPPSWVSLVFGRSLSRFFWVIAAGFFYRPDYFMGYHIFPAGLIVIIAGKIFRRPACYQMCAGPSEVVGGGIFCDNRLMRRLKSPSPLLERLAIGTLKRFDLIVVRGKKARDFLLENGVNSRISIIPGSIELKTGELYVKRTFDMVFAGRLSDIKQPFQFIEIFKRVHTALPDARSVMVGDGPLREDLKYYAKSLGIDKNIEFTGQRKDVESILTRSRVFVLTSKSEGLSIAMAEAMGSGAVPVVANVGELEDLVENGVNGFLIRPGDIQGFSDSVVALLGNNDLWLSCSEKAVSSARHLNGVDVVSEKWREALVSPVN